jgi:hypothetical protein
MAFDFNKISTNKHINAIDITKQYIKEHFDNISDNYNIRYRFLKNNFDYNLTFQYTSDNKIVLLGGYDIPFNYFINAEKFIYSVIPIECIEEYLNISHTLISISGNPEIMNDRIKIMQQISEACNQIQIAHISKSEKTNDNLNELKNAGIYKVIDENYNYIMKKLDPFPYLHDYCHCIFFNKLVVDKPCDIISKDDMFITKLKETVFYDTTHIIISGYFKSIKDFNDIKYTMPFKFLNEYGLGCIGDIFIGALVFEIPYILDDYLYKEVIKVQQQWDELQWQWHNPSITITKDIIKEFETFQYSKDYYRETNPSVIADPQKCFIMPCNTI